jgi:hypothetical protein
MLKGVGAAGSLSKSGKILFIINNNNKIINIENIFKN